MDARTPVRDLLEAIVECAEQETLGEVLNALASGRPVAVRAASGWRLVTPEAVAGSPPSRRVIDLPLSDALTVPADLPAREALSHLIAHGRPCALVVDGEQLLGMISEERLRGCAGVYEEAEQRRLAAETLAGVWRLLSQSLDPREVAQRIADGVREVFGARGAALYRLEPASEDLVPLATSREREGATAPDVIFRCGTGLVALAVRDRRPMVTPDVLADPRVTLAPEVRARIEQAPFRGVLAVPLLVRDRVIGALTIADRRDRVFTQDEIQLAQTFADQAAVALEHVRVFDETRRRRREAEVIAELARTINASLELDTVLQRVADGARELCGSDMASIALRESASGEVAFRYWSGARHPGIHLCVEPGRGLGGRVLLTGRPLRTDHYADDSRFSKDYLAYAQAEGIVADLAVPIRVNDRVEGLLHVQNRTARLFTDEDEEVLSHLAAQAAIAIQNARLFEESERRRHSAEMLAEVGRLVSQSLDPEEVAQRIADGVREIFRAEASTVYRLDPDSGDLVSVGISGSVGSTSGETIVMARGTGVSGLAVEAREPVISADVLRDARIRLTSEQRARAERASYGVVLAVPLMAQGRVIGALAIGAEKGRAFGHEEVQLARVFADQAAGALENARLHEETRRRRREAEVVAELARTINASLDLDTVLQRLAEGVKELCRSDVAEVALWDPDANVMLSRHVMGVRTPGYSAVRVEPGKGAAGLVTRMRQPFRTDNYAEDPRITKDYLAPTREEGVVAMLIVPIVAEDRVKGLLEVGHRTARRFTDDEEALLVRLAEHAAVAIQNARLFREQAGLLEETRLQREEAVALEAVARQITSSLEPDEVFQRIVDSVRELCACDLAFLAPYDQTTDTAPVVTASGARSQALSSVTITRGRGVGGKVLESGVAFLTDDYLHDSRITKAYAEAAALEGTVAQVVVPVRLKGAITGLLCAVNRTRRPFTLRDVQILSRLADQAAIALENARLFSEVTRRRREAEELARMARSLAESLDVEQVGRRIVESVLALFRAHRVALRLREPDGSLRLIAAAGTAAEVEPGHVLLPGIGTAGRAVAEGQPIWTRDTLNDPRIDLTDDQRRRLQAAGLAASLAVPVQTRDRTIGALMLGYGSSREFSAAEVVLLQAFADQAALALETARLFEETRTRLDETETLLAVARTLSLNIPVPDAMRRVSRVIAHAFDAEMVGAYALDAGGDALVPVAGYRVPKDLLDTLARTPFPIAIPFLQDACATGAPVWTSDYPRDPRFDQDFLAARRPRALLFAPTRVEGAIVGGLFLAWWTRERTFAPAELRLIEAVASLVGQALQRVRAEIELEDRLRQQAAIAELGRRALAGAGPQALMDEVVRLVAGALAVEYCNVLELRPDRTALLLRAGVGWKEGCVGHATVGMTGESQAGYTLLSDEPVIVEDLRTERRFNGPSLLHDHGVVSGLSVVIGSRGRPFGVLGAHTIRQRTFTKDDVGFLQSVASLLATAIDRNRAEEALRRSEARFRVLADTMAAAVFIYRGTQLLYANAALAALTGYSRAELLSMDVMDLVHPDSRDALRHRRLARQGGERVPAELEVKVVTKDRGEAWAYVSIATIEFDGAEARLATAVDFTARKRAEDAVRESEARFRSAFDDSRVGRALQALDGRYLRVNRALRDIIGYSEQQLLATSWQAFTHPEDLQAQLTLDAKLVAGEIGSYLTDKRYIHERGHVVWASVSISLLRDTAGTPMYVLAEIEDITSRREAEERIRFQASLLAQVRNAAIATDLTGRIVYWNKHAEALYRWSVAEVLGRDVVEVTVPPAARHVAAQVLETLRARGHWEGELVVQRKDGTTFPAHVIDTVIYDRGGKPSGFIGISIDISERKRAEEALRHHVERLTILHEIDQAIVAVRSPEAIAQAALHRVARVVSCWRASVNVFDFEARERTRLAVVGRDDTGFTAGTRTSLEVIGPSTIERLRKGEICVAQAVFPDSPLPSEGRAEDLYAHVLMVPLLFQAELIGSLDVWADQTAAFAPEQVEIAREVADSLAVAIQNSRLFAQVVASRERLHALSRRLVEVQEAERRRIARELHDEIGQVLTGLKLTLETTQGRPGRAGGRLEEARRLVNDLIKRARELSLDLRPAILDDLGLLPALLWHLERYSTQTGVRVRFEHAGLDRRFPPEVETAAYRIVQEALTNVARHAGVREASARAWAGEDLLHVQVEDRGQGFDARATRVFSGLTGMRERAELLGGRLTVESRPGAGTHVMAELPLDAPTERREAAR